MLLTALFSGMSPTFEYLRTHRFVNKDTFLKRVAVLTVRDKSSAPLKQPQRTAETRADVNRDAAKTISCY